MVFVIRSSPNHTPIKQRSPISRSNLITPAYLSRGSIFEYWFTVGIHFRLGLLGMMPLVLSSLPLWGGQGTRVWWWAWARRTHTLATRPSRNGAFWHWSTRSSTGLWATGMTWRRSGTTRSTMSCVWRPRSTRCCSPRRLSTPRPTVSGWPRSCSRPSMCLPCMSPSRRCSRCTRVVELPVRIS